jgi:hypothetical protein
VGDLFSYTFQIRLGPSNKENLCAFCRKFLCDRGANRTACAEHHSILSCRIADLFTTFFVVAVISFSFDFFSFVSASIAMTFSLDWADIVLQLLCSFTAARLRRRLCLLLNLG